MIHFLKHADIKWDFGDANRPWLSLATKPYSMHEVVDPFPCYSHDEELVRSEVDRIEKLVILPYKPDYFVLPFEGLGRTNGHASKNPDYDETTKKMNPYIVLAGKRICIHPAMTRYLISHEFGHVVHYNLENILNQEKNNEFERNYARFRNIEFNKEYGAQKWHTNIGEVIANDIRIILLNSEPEFWQHPYKHPLKDEVIVNYWNSIKTQYLSETLPLTSS